MKRALVLATTLTLSAGIANAQLARPKKAAQFRMRMRESFKAGVDSARFAMQGAKTTGVFAGSMAGGGVGGRIGYSIGTAAGAIAAPFAFARGMYKMNKALKR